jgi:acetyltransferase
MNLVRYTQIDYDREIAIIAEITERVRKWQAYTLIADPYNETAEFAIVVVTPGTPGTGRNLRTTY